MGQINVTARIVIGALSIITFATAVVACHRTKSKATSSAAATAEPTWCDVIEARPDPAVVTDSALRSAIEATGLPWRVRDRGTKIEMLLIPPGNFVMGMSIGDASASKSELPAHEVTLTKAFYLGRYEVTQPQWALVMSSRPSVIPDITDRDIAIKRSMSSGRTKSEAESTAPSAELARHRPVDGVGWRECQEYCQKSGLRLPTEAEWEFACRAGSREPRYGNQLSTIELGPTQPVGQMKGNEFGLHDMLGNVAEWTSDCYGLYSSDPQIDPRGTDPASSIGLFQRNQADRELSHEAWDSPPHVIRGVNPEKDLAVTASARTFSNWPGEPFKFNGNTMGSMRRWGGEVLGEFLEIVEHRPKTRDPIHVWVMPNRDYPPVGFRAARNP